MAAGDIGIFPHGKQVYTFGTFDTVTEISYKHVSVTHICDTHSTQENVNRASGALNFNAFRGVALGVDISCIVARSLAMLPAPVMPGYTRKTSRSFCALFCRTYIHTYIYIYTYKAVTSQIYIFIHLARAGARKVARVAVKATCLT